MKEHKIKREDFNYDLFRALIYNELHLGSTDPRISEKEIIVEMSIPGAELINDIILQAVRGAGYILNQNDNLNIGDSPFTDGESTIKPSFLANLKFEADYSKQDTSEFVINNEFKIIVLDTDTSENKRTIITI